MADLPGTSRFGTSCGGVGAIARTPVAGIVAVSREPGYGDALISLPWSLSKSLFHAFPASRACENSPAEDGQLFPCFGPCAMFVCLAISAGMFLIVARFSRVALD